MNDETLGNVSCYQMKAWELAHKPAWVPSGAALYEPDSQILYPLEGVRWWKPLYAELSNQETGQFRVRMLALGIAEGVPQFRVEEMYTSDMRALGIEVHRVFR